LMSFIRSIVIAQLSLPRAGGPTVFGGTLASDRPP
jgi:hypothetical protein